MLPGRLLAVESGGLAVARAVEDGEVLVLPGAKCEISGVPSAAAWAGVGQH